MRKPIRPRAGTRYSTRAQPVPWLTMCSMRPLRSASSCVVTPRKSSGTSIASRSTGSWTLPFSSRVTTWGLPTVSSKPSRRIASTSTASCSSPRPCTSQVSGRSVSSTRIETLPTSSWSRRSLTWRAVRREPERPASGEVLMPIVIPRAGSSIVDRRQRHWILGSGDRLADRDLRDARERHDLARPGLVDLDPPQPLGGVQLGDRGALHRSVAPAPGHRHALAQHAAVHAADRKAPDVRRRVEVGDQRLQAAALLVLGRRHPLHQQVEQRHEVAALADRARSRPSPPSRWCRRSGTRSAPRRRRGRGTARTPRSPPPPRARPGGRPCSPRGSPAAAARAPCAARSASAAAGPPRRRPAAARRRPCSGRAPPRRRSRRGPGVSTMLSFTSP